MSERERNPLLKASQKQPLMVQCIAFPFRSGIFFLVHKFTELHSFARLMLFN
jgi:hypothetical protein